MHLLSGGGGEKQATVLMYVRDEMWIKVITNFDIHSSLLQ